MRNMFGKFVIILSIVAMVSLSAFAKPTSKEVTFASDITVNGTMVKAGTYRAVFDDATGQLSIMKGNKTVATAPATLAKNEKSSAGPVAYETNNGNLTSVGLHDGNSAVVTGAASTSGM
jgi:hypothetical protein